MHLQTYKCYCGTWKGSTLCWALTTNLVKSLHLGGRWRIAGQIWLQTAGGNQTCMWLKMRLEVQRIVTFELPQQHTKRCVISAYATVQHACTVQYTCIYHSLALRWLLIATKTVLWYPIEHNNHIVPRTKWHISYNTHAQWFMIAHLVD